MAEALDYIDLPGLGAARGIWEYRRDNPHGLINEFGHSFVYGDNDALLADYLARRKSRVNYARSHPEEYIHPDGMLMAKREVIVSARWQGKGLPRRIVGVEIYPPFEDPEVQARELGKVAAAMETANSEDLERIRVKLSVLGMSEQV